MCSAGLHVVHGLGDKLGHGLEQSVSLELAKLLFNAMMRDEILRRSGSCLEKLQEMVSGALPVHQCMPPLLTQGGGIRVVVTQGGESCFVEQPTFVTLGAVIRCA
jgi:hypothetical protein